MLNVERNVMDSVKINREKLLGIVRENREKHITEYKEAVVDYQNGMILIAEHNRKISIKNVKLAKAQKLDKLEPMKSYLSAPQSYETEYNRALRMLELSVEENIDVEQDVFNQLVLDEWNWKRNFVASTALYKSVGSAR